MSTIDVQEIMSDIQKKVKKNTTNYDNLIDFIASKLSRLKIENEDEVLNIIVNNIPTNYFTKNEIKTTIQNKILYHQSNQDMANTLDNTKVNDFNSNLLGLIKGNQSVIDFKQMLRRLEKNQDLSSLSNDSLHFSKHHLSLVSILFHRQVTQNYLSALKWFLINDLVTKQTKFNSATESSIHHILILINELKNYDLDSEKWIQKKRTKIKPTRQ